MRRLQIHAPSGTLGIGLGLILAGVNNLIFTSDGDPLAPLLLGAVFTIWGAIRLRHPEREPGPRLVEVPRDIGGATSEATGGNTTDTPDRG